jgi:hypothetical protein
MINYTQLADSEIPDSIINTVISANGLGNRNTIQARVSNYGYLSGDHYNTRTLVKSLIKYTVYVLENSPNMLSLSEHLIVLTMNSYSTVIADALGNRFDEAGLNKVYALTDHRATSVKEALIVPDYLSKRYAEKASSNMVGDAIIAGLTGNNSSKFNTYNCLIIGKKCGYTNSHYAKILLTSLIKAAWEIIMLRSNVSFASSTSASLKPTSDFSNECADLDKLISSIRSV